MPTDCISKRNAVRRAQKFCARRIFVCGIDFCAENGYNNKAQGTAAHSGRAQERSMAEITAITPQIKDKTRCNIEIDGRFYCGLKLETAMKYRLKAGEAIDLSRLAAIQLESEKMTALDKALTHISSSMKTERQVRDYLKKKGYLDDVCDYVAEKMREYSYLDDAAYARSYAESAGKRKGKRLIRAELKQKGVDDAAIAEALEGLDGEDESAARVLEKYLRGKTADEKTFRKAYAHLIGKGYDHDTARRALTAYGASDED